MVMPRLSVGPPICILMGAHGSWGGSQEARQGLKPGRVFSAREGEGRRALMAGASPGVPGYLGWWPAALELIPIHVQTSLSGPGPWEEAVAAVTVTGG